MNIYQKINAVMKEVEYVQKTGKTAFKDVKYNYVTHDSVSASLHGPMARHGIVMIPSVDELTREGNLTIAKLNISFINMDDPNDLIIMTQYGYGIDTQDKGVGKAVSYAVKYALLKCFCLETGDDPEQDNVDKNDAINVSQELIDKKRNYLITLIASEDHDQFFQYIAVCAKSAKLSENEVYLRINDPKELLEKFQTWKDKQVKKEAKAA